MASKNEGRNLEENRAKMMMKWWEKLRSKLCRSRKYSKSRWRRLLLQPKDTKKSL